MLRVFLRDTRANYLVITAIAMVPLMGALALGLDYTEMSRQRQFTLNALDAAGIATARQIAQGATSTEAKAYARDFFEANLGPVDPDSTTLSVTLPNSNDGGGTLKLCASLSFTPRFLPAFQSLRNEGWSTVDFQTCSDVRLKSTLEVALVLDNSGSMNYRGSGSNDRRIDILKAAAKQLVDTIAAEGAQLKQINKAVQFGLVPFAASVNVGPQHADASWMDQDGISPVHHENFDWSTMPNRLAVTRDGAGVYRKTGRGWRRNERNKKVTRFTLYDKLRDVTHDRDAKWAGCVEMRPYPYGLNDAAADTSNPETLFVPMFAPDETDRRHRWWGAYNDWWADQTGGNDLHRQEFMPKYFRAVGNPSIRPGRGPNSSCTTKPVTPLTDVTKGNGLRTIKNAIDAMHANGATNVPAGMAWGWRVTSSGAPFTEGRPETDHGNDKVVIVLTDGANTYYTPQSLGAYDGAGNKSIYSNYGYAKNGRIFEGTSVNSHGYSNRNYTKAMNQQFAQLCNNAKANDLVVMTVALDLSSWKNDEKEQIDALKTCASNSRFRKDPNDPSKPAKLFWNAQGKDLEETFKEIADELSNLRIVG